jgi:hypothetical protein
LQCITGFAAPATGGVTPLQQALDPSRATSAH